MSETTKKAVPERRFHEFHDSGNWAEYRLENFATFYKGKGVSKVDIDIKGKTPCIRYGELYTHYSEVINTVISRTNLPENELFFSKNNDVIIPASGETKWDIAKASCVMLDDVALGGDLNVIRTNQNGVFISYYLNGAKKYEISKIAQGDSVVHLYASQLKLINLFLPPKPEEQQKIADCLSSLDDLITAQNQKVEALKQHKKGLMQQLFPAEGETVPKLRFPEFENDGEWVSKTISDVVKSVKTGKLDANAMVENGKYRFYTCAKNYYRINDYAFDGEALLIAGNGAYLGYIHHYVGKFNAYQRTYVLQEFDTDVKFLKYYLDRNLPTRILLEKKDGNTPYIVLSTITDMPLLVPKLDLEQKKIADCLTTLDELIIAQTQKLEAYKIHKRGLMQQLFPSLEEIKND